MKQNNYKKYCHSNILFDGVVAAVVFVVFDVKLRVFEDIRIKFEIIKCLSVQFKRVKIQFKKKWLLMCNYSCSSKVHDDVDIYCHYKLTLHHWSDVHNSRFE